MANEDYQLEELENAAVNKSNNAKRAAAAAGLFAAGGGTTYAATKIAEASTEPEHKLTTEDVEKAVKDALSQVKEPEVKPQPAPAPKPASEHHVAPKVEDHPNHQSPQDMVDHAHFDKPTFILDPSGERVGTIEEGTVNGHKIMLKDEDGDMRADYYAYDEDGNGVYNKDEEMNLYGKNQIAMGHDSDNYEHHIETPKVVDYNKYDPQDIVNNFEDEKTGEVYVNDYAKRSGDYSNDFENNQDVVEEPNTDTSDDDDEYDSLASNDEAADDTFDDLGSDALDIV